MRAANRALIIAAAAALLLLDEQHTAAASLMLNRAVIRACKAAERHPWTRSSDWRK